MLIEKTVVDSMELMTMEPKLTTTQPMKVTDFRRGGVGAAAFDLVGSTVCYRKDQLEPAKDLGIFCADWPTLGNERRVTEKPTTEGVSISADGKRIAFRTEVNGKAIEVGDTRTGGSQFVAGCANGMDGAPQWSPDGGRLAYSCSGAGDQGLYTVQPEGMQIRKLRAEPATPFEWR